MDTRKLEVAIAIVKRLVKKGFESYFAGGYARDQLLGFTNSDDIDIVTSASPKQISEIFDRVIGVGEQFGVMLVVENGYTYELATFRTDIGTSDGRHPQQIIFSDAKTDAQRRDFTINGIFYDPLEDKYFDFVDGTKDLKNGIIRTIGNPDHRFTEDYLRLLRAIRFAARFSFSIEPGTWKSIQQKAAHITKVSPERVFQELNKMLLGPNPEKAFRFLEKSDLLMMVLPEVQSLRGVEQPPEYHPEGDVLTHTLKTLSYLQSPSMVTAWSALLHDIGKPATQTYTDRIRFNNHHYVSAIMARKILNRLRTPRQFITKVCQCIENHMNFMNVTQMRLSTLKKFLARSTIESELELHRADCLASHGNIENYHYLQEKKAQIAKENLQPQPLISGKDLINLGFTPGPIFGRILQTIYDLQLNEKITTSDEAFTWIKENQNELKKL